MANEDFGFIPDPVAPSSTTNDFGFVPDPVTTEQANLSEGEKFKILQGNIEGTKEFLAKKYGVPVEKVTVEPGKITPTMTPDLTKPSPVYTAPVPAYKESTETAPGELVVDKNGTKIKTGVKTSDNQTPEMGSGVLGGIGRSIEREAIPLVSAGLAARFQPAAIAFAPTLPGKIAAGAASLAYDTAAWTGGVATRDIVGYIAGTYKPKSASEEAKILASEAYKAGIGVTAAALGSKLIGLAWAATKAGAGKVGSPTNWIATHALTPEQIAMAKKAPLSLAEDAKLSEANVENLIARKVQLDNANDEIKAMYEGKSDQFKKGAPKAQAAETIKSELKTAKETEVTSQEKGLEQALEENRALQGQGVGALRNEVSFGPKGQEPVDVHAPFITLDRDGGMERQSTQGLWDSIQTVMKREKLVPTGDPVIDATEYGSRLKIYGERRLGALKESLDRINPAIPEAVSQNGVETGMRVTEKLVTINDLKAASDEIHGMINKTIDNKALAPFAMSLVKARDMIEDKLAERLPNLRAANIKYAEAKAMINAAKEKNFLIGTDHFSKIANGEVLPESKTLFDSLRKTDPESKKHWDMIEAYHQNASTINAQIQEAKQKVDAMMFQAQQGIDIDKKKALSLIESQKSLDAELLKANAKTAKELDSIDKKALNPYTAQLLVGGLASGNPGMLMRAGVYAGVKAKSFLMNQVASKEKAEIISNIINKLPVGSYKARAKALSNLGSLESLGVERLVPMIEQADVFDQVLGVSKLTKDISASAQKEYMKIYKESSDALAKKIGKKVDAKMWREQVIYQPLRQEAARVIQEEQRKKQAWSQGGVNAPIRK